MYAFADNQQNKITLSQLMAFYRGRKIIFDNIEKKLLPNQLQTALFGEFGKTTESNVRKGIAYERFKACVNVFEDKYAEEILENWNNEWQNLISHSQDGDTKTAIPPRKCAERIINGEREILKKICPELLRWLDNALNLNSDNYLKTVFSVLTILAITRDKTGEHWTAFAEKLLNNIPNFLPIINVLSDEPSTEAQKTLEECKRLHSQGDLEQAKKFRDTAFEKNKPLWNSNVWREWANLQSEDAFKSYLKARAFLEDALKKADKEELRKQWREISDEFLKETITRLKLGDETFMEDFKNDPPKEEFYRHWYGTAFFRLANFYLDLDDKKKFIEWLLRGVEVQDEESKNSLMYLCPLEGEISYETSDTFYADKGYKLAMELQNSALPKIKGSANWRLYLLTKDEAERERYLQAAYESDFPPAIQEHNKGIVSYVKEFKEATCDEGGQYFLNVTKKHPLAKIFLKTVPQNWSILSAVKKQTSLNFICLLIDESPQKNLQDFLTLLQRLKENPPQSTTIYIRGERDILTPITDTALKQYYNEKNRPLLRVEILDDELNLVRNLFARRPLFLPLLTRNPKEATTLHLMVIGSTKLCLQAVREADWFLTFPAELKIKSKITLFAPSAENQLHELRFSANLSDKIKAENVLLPGLTHPTSEFKDLSQLISLAVEASEALYFVIDVGNDLQNLSLAIEIRKILTRAYLRFSETLPCTPIGFRCKNVDFAFMSQRLIVLGEERSDGNFNNHHLTPISARYTWQELINNIDSRLAMAVHMVYFGVHADENFSDKNCYEAFLDFSRRTYNQRSSLAVVHSLMTRIFVIERLLGVKIFDETWQNTQDFFSKTNRKKILEHEIISLLKEFYELLKQIVDKLKSLWNNINEFKSVTAWKKFSAILDEFISQKNFPTCKRLKKFLGELEEVTLEDDIPEEKRWYLLDKLVNVQSDIESKIKSMEQIFIFEHNRWTTFLQASEGWQSVTSEEAIKYINLGNNKHHQNYLTKQHPCLVDWCHLKTVADDLNQALKGTKDFKKYDIASVLATGEFLSESVLREDSETTKNLRRLFCVTKEDLTL
jgi:hypothetical protein